MSICKCNKDHTQHSALMPYPSLDGTCPGFDPAIGLRLDGFATDHIWLMEDGPATHPIGMRLDCGDSGTVYLSREQARDLSEQLSAFSK